MGKFILLFLFCINFMLFASDYPYSKKETMKLFILDENLNDDKMAKILNNCKNNSGKDCFINGILFVNNQYFEQNLSLALDFFTFSCDYNYPNGCVIAGSLDYIINKDKKTVLNFTKKACEMNAIYCNDLGLVYKDFIKDNEKAKIYFEISCNAGNLRACKNLQEF